MKKFAVGASVALALGSLVALPASAGDGGHTMTVSAEVSYVGETVEIANASGDLNTCVGQTIPSADTVPVQVDLEVDDPNGDLIVDVKLDPDAEGNWSYEVGPLETIGVYTVYASCEELYTEVGAAPSAIADFRYEPIEFEAIAQPATTTTTAAPTTTTTAAAVSAAAATPRFAG